MAGDGVPCHEHAQYSLMKPKGVKFLAERFATDGAPEHVAWLPVDRFCEYDTHPAFFGEKQPPTRDGAEHVMTHA